VRPGDGRVRFGRVHRHHRLGVGLLADRNMAHYNSSKAGVVQLARIAAAELGHRGIRVNVIAPGTTDTPLFARTDAVPGYREAVSARTPLGSIGSADDVAAAAVALAQLRWVTGQVLVADGGVSLRSPIDIADFLAAAGSETPVTPAGLS